MATTAEDGRVGAVAVPATRRTAAGAVGALLAVELAAVAAYLHATNTGVLAPRYTLYPFVWINLAAWVLLRRRTVAATARRRLAAGALAAGYFLVLAYAGGLLGHAHGAATPSGRVMWLSPGWGPMLVYSGPVLEVTVVPFEVVGYAALAVLVYTVLLAGARSALAGVLGVATCVGCLWPVGAALAAALGVAASPLATAVPGLAYDLSTLLFVVTAGVLHVAARRSA